MAVTLDSKLPKVFYLSSSNDKFTALPILRVAVSLDSRLSCILCLHIVTNSLHSQSSVVAVSLDSRLSYVFCLHVLTNSLQSQSSIKVAVSLDSRLSYVFYPSLGVFCIKAPSSHSGWYGQVSLHLTHQVDRFSLSMTPLVIGGPYGAIYGPLLVLQTIGQLNEEHSLDII